MFTAPSQVLFSFMGVNIYYYGIILAFAITLGTLVADFVATRYFNLKKETIIDLSPYLVVFGIIGARLYYCLYFQGDSESSFQYSRHQSFWFLPY